MRVRLSKYAKRRLLRYGKIPQCLRNRKPDALLAQQLGDMQLFRAFKEAYELDGAEHWSPHACVVSKQLRSVDLKRVPGNRGRRSVNSMEILFEQLH